MNRDLLIVCLFIGFDLFVLLPIIFTLVVKFGWSPMRRRFPPREIAPDALRRNFQSFRFGILNFGMSIHVAVDEHCLHLIPARFLRWFGAGPVSVPWDAVTIRRRALGGRWISASFDGRSVMGPGWCLALAEPAEAGDQAETPQENISSRARHDRHWQSADHT